LSRFVAAGIPRPSITGEGMRASICWAFVAFGLAGCCDLRSWISDSHKPGEVVTPKMAEASVEAAKRVDKVGRQLIAGNSSLGMDITFQTVGGTFEPEIYHRDSHGVFITESLVNLCATDDKLAAVLASELGHMVGEARHRERMQIPEPIPNAARGPKLDGVTDYDPGRDMELAMYDKQFRKPSEKANWPSANPKVISEGILKEAKIEPQSLAEVAPLLKEAKRNHALAKQFGGAPDVPHWTR